MSVARRDLLVATGTVPVGILASPSRSAASDLGDSSEIKKLISAFFEAGNTGNWLFFSQIIDDFVRFETNDSHWSAWAHDQSSEDVKKTLKQGPMGSINGSDSVVDFFRSRQKNMGWKWTLPKGVESVWCPVQGSYCSYALWDRTDGGSYFKVVPRNPRYLHIFGFDITEDFDAVVSRKISWVQEVSLDGIVYG